ncbi:glycosyltransferase [Amylibacter sp.]|nr:glycosyltransferase [Amylibacter sp.]
MQSELIISTFNKPNHLRVVLSSLLSQNVMPNKICIADDGSDSRTHKLIKSFKLKQNDIPIRHVWHPNKGFRKNLILNQSVISSTAEYLIFVDDDCIMHPTFIKRHLSLAKRGSFLSGSVIRLDNTLTNHILEDGIIEWNSKLTPLDWRPTSISEYLKSMPLKPKFMSVLDKISPIRCSWSGGNASTFREHIFFVNGFNTTLNYGGEDKEFGVRLINARIKARHLRYSAPLYHLEHDRGYINDERIKENREMIINRRFDRSHKTKNGIFQ